MHYRQYPRCVIKLFKALTKQLNKDGILVQQNALYYYLNNVIFTFIFFLSGNKKCYFIIEAAVWLLGTDLASPREVLNSLLRRAACSCSNLSRSWDSRAGALRLSLRVPWVPAAQKMIKSGISIGIGNELIKEIFHDRVNRTNCKIYGSKYYIILFNYPIEISNNFNVMVPKLLI